MTTDLGEACAAIARAVANSLDLGEVIGRVAAAVRLVVPFDAMGVWHAEGRRPAPGARPIAQTARRATKVAETDTTVLVTGESGTGKEVIARFIHRASRRAERPFVALSCAVPPEQLLESELFGHERGAFTGAHASRPGKVEQASGGILFLDEVAEMTPPVQAKFLRLLQEREFQRLGGTARDSHSCQACHTEAWKRSSAGWRPTKGCAGGSSRIPPQCSTSCAGRGAS